MNELDFLKKKLAVLNGNKCQQDNPKANKPEDIPVKNTANTEDAIKVEPKSGNPYLIKISDLKKELSDKSPLIKFDTVMVSLDEVLASLYKDSIEPGSIITFYDRTSLSWKLYQYTGMLSKMYMDKSLWKDILSNPEVHKSTDKRKNPIIGIYASEQDLIKEFPTAGFGDLALIGTSYRELKIAYWCPKKNKWIYMASPTSDLKREDILKARDVNIRVVCNRSCEAKSRNVPYRRGDNVYIIDECGNEVFLFNIKDSFSKFRLTIVPPSNGIITASMTEEIPHNTPVKVTATPSNAELYKFVKLIDSVAGEVREPNYTYISEEDRTVSAVFEPVAFTGDIQPSVTSGIVSASVVYTPKLFRDGVEVPADKMRVLLNGNPITLSPVSYSLNNGQSVTKNEVLKIQYKLSDGSWKDVYEETIPIKVEAVQVKTVTNIVYQEVIKTFHVETNVTTERTKDGLKVVYTWKVVNKQTGEVVPNVPAVIDGQTITTGRYEKLFTTNGESHFNLPNHGVENTIPITIPELPKQEVPAPVNPNDRYIVWADVVKKSDDFGSAKLEWSFGVFDKVEHKIVEPDQVLVDGVAISNQSPYQKDYTTTGNKTIVVKKGTQTATKDYNITSIKAGLSNNPFANPEAPAMLLPTGMSIPNTCKISPLLDPASFTYNIKPANPDGFKEPATISSLPAGITAVFNSDRTAINVTVDCKTISRTGKISIPVTDKYGKAGTAELGDFSPNDNSRNITPLGSRDYSIDINKNPKEVIIAGQCKINENDANVYQEVIIEFDSTKLPISSFSIDTAVPANSVIVTKVDDYHLKVRYMCSLIKELEKIFITVRDALGNLVKIIFNRGTEKKTYRVEVRKHADSPDGYPGLPESSDVVIGESVRLHTVTDTRDTFEWYEDGVKIGTGAEFNFTPTKSTTLYVKTIKYVEPSKPDRRVSLNVLYNGLTNYNAMLVDATNGSTVHDGASVSVSISKVASVTPNTGKRLKKVVIRRNGETVYENAASQFVLEGESAMKQFTINQDTTFEVEFVKEDVQTDNGDRFIHVVSGDSSMGTVSIKSGEAAVEPAPSPAPETRSAKDIPLEDWEGYYLVGTNHSGSRGNRYFKIIMRADRFLEARRISVSGYPDIEVNSSTFKPYKGVEGKDAVLLVNDNVSEDWSECKLHYDNGSSIVLPFRREGTVVHFSDKGIIDFAYDRDEEDDH